MQFRLALAAVTALSLAACTTTEDVPAPADADAQNWTPQIKQAYPDWQPPKQMTAENPDYRAALEQSFKADAQAQVVKEADDGSGAVLAPAIDETKAASFARIDVLAKNEAGTYPVNGSTCTVEELRTFLKKMAEANPDAVVLIYYEEAAGTNALEALKSECKASGISKVNVVSDKALFGDVKQPAGKKAAAAAVDTGVPAAKHTVKKGETLSTIAKKYYGNGNLWTFIYNANKDVLKGGPNKLKAGMTISIPALKK